MSDRNVTPRERLKRLADQCDEVVHIKTLGRKIVCVVCAAAAIREVEKDHDRLLAEVQEFLKADYEANEHTWEACREALVASVKAVKGGDDELTNLQKCERQALLDSRGSRAVLEVITGLRAYRAAVERQRNRSCGDVFILYDDVEQIEDIDPEWGDDG